MKNFNQIKIIGIDHGYGNIKTANHCFKMGIMAFRDFSLDDIRTVIREELQATSFISSEQIKAKVANTELTEEQKAENEKNILSDLRQYRTKIVRKMRSQIFRQIAENHAGILAYFKKFSVKMT